MNSIYHLISHAIDYLTKCNSVTDILHFRTRRHLYYALVRTLHQGSEATVTHSARPSLPLELIIQILRDAECAVLSRLSRHVGGLIDEEHEVALGTIYPQNFPAPDLAKTGWPLPVVNGRELSPCNDIWSLCDVSSVNSNPIRKLWFTSAELSARDLANMHSMQLLTRSRDQGWVINAGSWSWFDIVLIPKWERWYKQSWLSHDNGPPASTMRVRAGAIFEPDHAIWQLAQVGDRIGVRACAQFGGWRNVATMALLIFQEYFIPTFVPQ